MPDTAQPPASNPTGRRGPRRASDRTYSKAADNLPPPPRPEDKAQLLRDLQGVPNWLQLSAAWSWRLIIVGLGILGAAWVLSQLFLVTMPVLIAIVLSTMLIPVAEALERRGVPPAAAGLIVVFGSLGILGGILAALAPSFVSQLRDLAPTLAEGRDTVLRWLETGPLGLDPATVDDMLISLRDSFGNNSEGVVGGIVEGAAFVGEAITAFALMLVLLFFFVKDRDLITGWARLRLPAKNRDTASALGQRAWRALSGYVRGTATIALIDAIGIGIGLAVIGVPLALPLTFLVFLGGFLPVVGAFAAGLVAVLVALAAGGASKAVAALVLILVVQQLEGHILQPVIMRRAVALHPTVILISLAAGAAISGIVGAFLAVPLAAVGAAVGNELRLRGNHEDEAHDLDDEDPTTEQVIA